MKETTRKAVEETRREFEAAGKFHVGDLDKEFTHALTLKVGPVEWCEWVKEEHPEHWEKLLERREERRRREECRREDMMDFVSYASLVFSILALVIAVVLLLKVAARALGLL